MDSSIDVAGATGGSVASEGERDPGFAEPREPGRRRVGRWFARHGASLRWFLPLILLATGVHVLVLGMRADRSDLPVGVSAIVFASIGAALLWLLARRLQLTQPASAAAVFIFLLSPLALTAHTVSPLQNAAVPVLLAGASVAVDSRRSTRHRMIVGAVMAAIFVVLLVFGFAAAGDSGSSTAFGRWWALDPLVLVLGVGCSVVALALSRLRPFALLSLGLVLLALRPGAGILGAGSPGADAPMSAAALWLPLAALLVAGTVQAAARAAWDAGFTEVWLEILSGVFLVAVVGVLIFAAPALAPGYRALLAGTAPAEPTDSGRTAASVVPGSASPSDSGAATGTVPGQSAGGTGTSTSTSDAAVDSDAVTASRKSARASAGLELSANPHLALAPSATAELVAGDVDVRSILTLAQLLASAPVAVADFPGVDGEVGPPRRQILITSLDGRPEGGDTTVSDAVAKYFVNLAPPLGGARVVSTAEGALVIFPFGEPVDLLPAGPAP